MKRNFAILLWTSLLVLTACSQAKQAPEKKPLSNEALGISIPALPNGWTVVANTGTDLRLAPSAPEKKGELRVDLAPSELGSNLVAAIHAHQREIEARKGGKYLGARELSGPLGTAFYSRGRFRNDQDLETEETTVFTLHPRGKGILALAYDYPVGEDSSARVQNLLDLFAELE